MKLSVSIPDEDVRDLDEYVRAQGLPSRSAAVQRAVRELSRVGLEDDYEAAYAEWEASGEAGVWAAVSGDGLAHEAR